MDFAIGLPISANWKGDSYSLMLIIVIQLIKMIHCKPVKATIDAPSLAEVIINVIVHYHRILKLIVID